MQDPYKTLGVSRDVNQADIKKAYRALAKKMHPDLHPGDKKNEQKFKDITAAYHLLSDKEKRAQFDRGEIDAGGTRRAPHGFYRAYTHGGPDDRFTQFSDGGSFQADDLFSDLFSVFRGRGGRGMKARGANVTHKLQVSFLEAVNGVKKRVTLATNKRINVTIPPDTENGQTLRLAGQGLPGAGGGPAGDALIEIQVQDHPFFERKGHDIHVDVPVTLQEAVLGGRITVPTIDGKVTLTVPKGSNSGTILRLKNKGVTDRRTKQRGDQFVRLRVVLPDVPDQDLNTFVTRWAPAHDYDVRRKAGME